MTRLTKARVSLTRVEWLLVFSVLGVLAALLGPAVLSSTEWARRTRCQNHLKRIGLALHAYHSTYHVLPPAAVWSSGQRRSVALHVTERIDQITYTNWAVMLLPYLDEERLAQEYDSHVPMAHQRNAGVRTTRLSVMTCPSDTYNRRDNPFEFRNEQAKPNVVPFARGNYAINGGSQNHRILPGTSAQPVGDGTTLIMVPSTRTFQYWGNGVAGFNRSFSFQEFSNGLATTVAVDEIRAGIHPLDLRGVWALGQIGSSVTWAHGVNGDAYGPNNNWPRSDDILGCEELERLIGRNRLTELGMPCCWYCRRSQQATSRSLHPGGVNVLMADGATRFVANTVDPGLWHVMHSRETPEAVLAEGFDKQLHVVNYPEAERENTAQSSVEGRESRAEKVPGPESRDQRPTNRERREREELRVESPETSDGGGRTPVNSIGMTFALLPAGEFLMGVPDEGNAHDSPPECPAHPVHITRPILMGRHEVTRRQFQKVMGTLPVAELKDSSRQRASSDQADVTNSSAENARDAAAATARYDWPVTNVTWFEANAFCRRLSRRPEEQAAGRWYRLPSEAEWEYACRSGRSEPYRWSSQRRPDDASGENAGIHPPLPLKPVGSYPANAFGLFDMRGNAWEWTADWFDRDYYRRSPVDDPRGPAHGYLKVVRGGDWRFIGEPCRIDYPILPPWKSNPFVGFRVVCEQRNPMWNRLSSRSPPPQTAKHGP